MKQSDLFEFYDVPDEILNSPRLLLLRCGQYFTKAENTGPCFYHPGHWREPSPHAGALVGWSCCAVAGFVDEYNLLSIMNQNAMNKDSKGCTEAQQHEEDPDYTRATSVFPFHPEDLSMGGLAGLKNRKTGETAGAAQTKTPTPDQTIGTNCTSSWHYFSNLIRLLTQNL